MEACLGLSRRQRNLNKQRQKDIKVQDQHQLQHTKFQQQKQQTQATITNQNYYTTQQQPQNQRHLVARGQTTNVGVLKTELQQQQQQHNEESHSNATSTTPCTTPPKYQNTAATTSNMHQPSLSTANYSAGGVESVVQQQPHPQPQTISFEKNTVMVEVTPTLPSTIGSTNPLGIVNNTNVNTFRKINTQSLRQQQQQKHQHHIALLQQQGNEADIDAIEVCEDPERHVPFNGGGELLRQSKTLERINHQKQHQQQHQHIVKDHQSELINMSQITSLQLLQLQQQQQHDYSYAYYEPGAVMRHTNIPQADLMVELNEKEDLIPPPPNSIRALPLKGKKNKLLVSPATQQSFQTRLTQQQGHNLADAMASANCSNISTPKNCYEEISLTSSSSNSRGSPHQLRATSHMTESMTRTLVEEELRKVLNRHHRILDELNLSVEAMLMPECPPNISPMDKEKPLPAVSVTTNYASRRAFLRELLAVAVF